jgi:hypothetical protein
LVVAEVLTGIALVQQSVKFIKENISTAQDIGQIAGQIDDLFRGEKEAQKARSEKSGKSSFSDQFGVETVAQEIIDAKLASEKLYEVSQLVDLRFGHGTWAGIVAERAKRIQQAKEAAAAERKAQAKKQKEIEETIKTTLLIAGIILVTIALFAFLFVSISQSNAEEIVL